MIDTPFSLYVTEGKGEGEPLPPRSRNRVNSLSLRHSLRSQGNAFGKVIHDAGVLSGHVGQANKQDEHASEYKNNDGGSKHDPDGAPSRE